MLATHASNDALEDVGRSEVLYAAVGLVLSSALRWIDARRRTSAVANGIEERYVKRGVDTVSVVSDGAIASSTLS